MTGPQKIVFLLLALFIANSNLQAQQKSDHTFLWQLNAASGNEIYLVGTLPMDNSDLINTPKSVQQAFDDVDIVVFDKSPLDLKAEYQRLFAEKGFYPVDEMIAEHLDTELYQQLEKRLEELNSPLGHMPRMKPWLIAISLNNLETEAAGYSRIALKEYYFNQASAEQKEILLLNTGLSEQRLLSSLPEAAQIEYLQHCLKNSKKNIRQNSRLFKAWRKGNFKKFSSLIQKQQRRLPAAIQEVQHKLQNNIEVDELIEIINSDKNALIFLEATRLVGKNGLLNKLETEGIEISKL